MQWVNEMINGPEVPPLSGNKPKSLVIFLHGYGADGFNLIDLAKFLGNDLPDTQFLAPNAPEKFELAESGYQWFSLQDRSPNTMLELVKNAEIELNKYIDHQIEKFSIGDEKIVLIGFSQGTMVSLHTALRRNKAIAGIIGFSGALLGPDILANHIKSRPNVVLFHGDQDDVVPYSSMMVAKNALEANNVNVKTHTMVGAGHYISYEGIDLACKSIKEFLS